jgi:hypothetical protein
MRIRHLASAISCIAAAAWLLAASSALAAPRSTAAPAAAQLDSFPNSPDVLLWPAQPCVDSDVIIYVRAFLATPCDSFLSAYRSGESEITIRTITHSDRQCDIAPYRFYAVRIPFGQLPAGPQTVQVRRNMLITQGGVVTDSLVNDSQVQFSVASACPAPPPPMPAGDLPYVDHVAKVPTPACPERPVIVHLDGHVLGCGNLVSAGLDGGIKLVLQPNGDPPVACPWSGSLKPWSADVSLGQMAPGTYSVLVQETLKGADGLWPPIPDAEYKGLFDYNVAQQCESTSTGLPFVSNVSVTGGNLPRERICPGEPIRVSLHAVFPNACWTLRKIELVPGSPTPVTRFLFDDNACRGGLCPPLLSPLDTSVVTPGTAAGTWNQIVQVGLVSCTDSIPPESLFTASVPFTVQPPESCTVGVGPPSCLLPAWLAGIDGCAASLDPDGAASLDFEVASGTALSGLQGEFRFVQSGLRVTSMEAIGPAAQMHLAWTATLTGARFVMFAEHGAPIPIGRKPLQVLRVHLLRIAVPDHLPGPDHYDVVAERVLGSDEAGQEVPACPTAGLAAVVARVCVEQACDFDGNGIADVRDLVRMVHCVNGDGPCPPDSLRSFDCNGDSVFDLADVICCAMHLLQGPACPDCPIDSTRDEPSVHAAFGDPIVTASGVDIPLHLSGTDRLGAARLALRFPSDRFTFAGAEIHDAAWLELHQGGSGSAAVGLIRIAPNLPQQSAISAQTVDVLLHLALRAGASSGGEISLASSEFSGPDGKLLHVDLGATPRSLGGTATLTISSIRPNPSPGSFQIDLALDAPARVDVAVLDLAGRKVAQLFQGDLAAGARRFVWDGGKAGGVYFLRASVGGQVVTRKLILVRSTMRSG